MPKKERTSTKAYCTSCSNNTWHKILKDKTVYPPEYVDYNCKSEHLLVECSGCQNVSYVYEFHDMESYYQDDFGDVQYDIETKQYPRSIRGHRLLKGLHAVPRLTKDVYNETIDAISVQSYTLASIGLRATIESICNDKDIKGKDLTSRIKKMTTAGLLSKKDADRLHSIRFLGNDAAHEIRKARRSAVLLALDIVEHTLKSVYIFDDAIEDCLETPFRNYKELKESLLRRLKKLDEGHQFTLNHWLGPERRRIIENKANLERELLEDITQGHFDGVISLGKKEESGQEKEFYEKRMLASK